MTEAERDRLLSEALEDFHRRRAMGELPEPAQYVDRLGDSHAEFLEILAAEAAIDEAIFGASKESLDLELPRPFGPYTLLSELGHGAVGVVYEALHRDLGRKVALKVLRTDFSTDPRARERFRREARACAQVRHPNLVEIYEAGEAEGRPYYAMTLLPGEPLNKLVKEGRAPEPKALFRGLAAVADGLEVLHREGIIHRDVKPNNVMVEPGGKMILADFGLARTASSVSLTHTGEAVGTPLYMSPEQMLGKKDEIDARTDVYGLGATLYEALAGRPVFKTDDLATLMRMVLSQRPQAIHVFAPAVPDEAEAIVMKALEKRREDRYASAGALRDDMLAFVEGRPVQGKPVSMLRHRLRHLRRRWKPIAAAAAVVLGFGWWWTSRPATITVEEGIVALTVSVDGEVKGTARLSMDVPAGRHRLRVEGQGYVPFDGEIRLSPGEELTYMFPMQLAAAEYPDGRTRGEGDPMTLLYPREDVRVQDLESCVFEVDITQFDPENKGGNVVFRKGKRTLAEVPFVVPNLPGGIGRVTVPIPAAVRDSVKAGDDVTWGYAPLGEGPKEPKGHETLLAKFSVVGKDLSKQLRKIDQMPLKGSDVPAAKAHHRAQLFLNYRLYAAALAEALKVAEADPSDARSRAFALVALERMKIHDSRMASDLRTEIDGIPEPKKAGVVRARGR